MEFRVLPKLNGITQIDFINVIKKLKGLGLKDVSNKENILDIFYEEENNIRTTIHGDVNINSYCNKNSVMSIKEHIEFIEKKRFSYNGQEVKPLDLRNYGIRGNIKEEKNMTLKNKKIIQLLNRLPNLKKVSVIKRGLLLKVKINCSNLI